MEQPLPPNGACLLGSFNLTKYVHMRNIEDIMNNPDTNPDVWFDYKQFCADIPPIVRMMDNVIDRTIYPLPEQEAEAKAKRRMGLGVTGLANAAEFLGYEYGSPEMLEFTKNVLSTLRDIAYDTSVNLAQEKGPFPKFSGKYLDGEFIKTFPDWLWDRIAECGIRNSHLLSIAPTGTISLWADNISSGIEPPFSLEYDRKTIMPGVEGEVKTFRVFDYAWDQWGIRGKTSEEISAVDHINVLTIASSLVDSACSKTCNVGDNVTFEEFKNLYMMAYDGGASGCTTFRPAGFRKGVLTKIEEPVEEGAACFIDPLTGSRHCAD